MQLVEIKGNHLLKFDENSKVIGLKNPYDDFLDEKLDLKFKCMEENNVKLVLEKEINLYKKEIINEYGKKFLDDLIYNSKCR